MKYQIAVQDAAGADAAAAVNRSVIGVVGADLIQQFSHGEELAYGADVKMVIGLQIYQHARAAAIHDLQSPHRVLVTGLVEHRLDVRRNIGTVRAWSGLAHTAATAAEGEDRGDKKKTQPS
jgi:hypothetical protein